MHKKPAAYQEMASKLQAEGRSTNGTRAAVESAFKKIGENAYGFKVGAYDTGQELVIDPVVLAYSTYLGGSGEDVGYGITVDGSGNAYVTGCTYSTNFPTLNQYQIDQASRDVFVTKLDTTKSGNASLIYSTYLGGNSEDGGLGIAVDNSGNAYVTGYTVSSNFPTLNQYQTDQPGYDAFVAKLDTTKSGNASLVYSTYLGGNSEEEGLGIAVDDSGNAYVTGQAWSTTNFPTLNQYQTYPGDGNWNAFVTKIDTTKNGNASLVYSTYLGGHSADQGRGIAVDKCGNAYVTGVTNSTDFPTLNPYQQLPQSITDAFVTKLDTTKSGNASLVYSTYLGGTNTDLGRGIAADDSGNAYVTGYTASTDFPTLNQYQTHQANADAFVTKLDTTKSGNACLVYSTYLGGNNTDWGLGIAVDNIGNAYVTGYTYSTNFPALNQYQTDQSGSDVFVAKLDTTKSGTTSMIYSTYLGGSGHDGDFTDNSFAGIAVDGSGNAYVTGYTLSANFPVVNQYQTDPGDGNYDAFIAKIRASADIAVTKTSDSLEPKFGDEFNFTVTATNNGPMEATGLKVTDKLPTGLGYVSSTPSKGAYDSGTGIWNIGSLIKDASATLTLKAGADGSGEVTNTASVSALNEFDPDNSNDSASADVTILIPCTIETSPSGLSIDVDAVSSIAPQTFYWAPGSSHSIGVTSPQTGTGTKYIYSSWSDTGQQTHTITMPSSATTYTASFAIQYDLTTTANPLAGGTVTPAGTNYYDEGQNVQVQAASNAGYIFTGWSGDLVGYDNPATVTMDGPRNIIGNFVYGKTLNAPVLVEPANNTTGQPNDIILKWLDTNSSPQEKMYNMRIKKAGGVYANYQLAANTVQYLKSGLTPSAVYYWNVQALGDSTNTKHSPWANGGIDFTFTVKPPDTLNMPVLVAPANGAIGQPKTLTFRWQDTNTSPQEVRYKIRLKPAGGAYVNFTSPADATAYLRSGLAGNKVYYWSVQAKGNGTTIKDSAWPADWRFTTIQ